MTERSGSRVAAGADADEGVSGAGAGARGGPLGTTARERRWARPLRLLAAACVLTAPACHGGEPATTYAQRDSAGIRIVEVRSVPESPSLRLRAEPVLSIGAESGEPAETFDRIQGVVRLPDGTVYVADMGSDEIRSFSARGAHLATFGGRGEGPGEFSSLGGLVRMAGDSIAGFDRFVRMRLNVFDRDGRFGHTVTLPTLGDGYVAPLAKGATSSGALVLAFARTPALDLGRSGSTYLRPRIEMTLFSPSTGRNAPLGTFDGETRRIEASPSAISINSATLGGNTFVGARGRVAVGTSDLGEIRIFEGARLVRIVRFEDGKRPVDDAVRARILRHRVAEASPGNEAAVRSSFAGETLPDSIPVFSAILVDARNRVWVERYQPEYETGPTLWWIIGTDGRIEATIALPHRFTPHQVDDSLIVGVERDELDVERVREYTFEPG